MLEFKKLNPLYCKWAIALTFILNPISSELYRPWIYKNNVWDFGVANSMTSYLGCITLIFLAIYLDKLQPTLKTIVAVSVGCVLYECIQPFFKLGVFDIGDIVAVLLASLSVIVILPTKISPIKSKHQTTTNN